MSESRVNFERAIVERLDVASALAMLNRDGELDPNQPMIHTDGERKTPLQFLLKHLPLNEVFLKLQPWCAHERVEIDLGSLKSRLDGYSNNFKSLEKVMHENDQRQPKRAVVIAEYLRRATRDESLTANQLIEHLSAAFTGRLWLAVALSGALDELSVDEINAQRGLQVLRQCIYVLNNNPNAAMDDVVANYGPNSVPVDADFGLQEEGYLLACTHFNTPGCRNCYKTDMQAFRHGVRDAMLEKFGINLSLKERVSNKIDRVPTEHLGNLVTMLDHMRGSPLFTMPITRGYQRLGLSSTTSDKLRQLSEEATRQLNQRSLEGAPRAVTAASVDIGGDEGGVPLQEAAGGVSAAVTGDGAEAEGAAVGGGGPMASAWI